MRSLTEILRYGKRFLCEEGFRFQAKAYLGFYNEMPDAEYLSRMFLARMGKPLDLEHPKTFNEKLQWLKLYDRNPRYTMLVDKYLVRQYIADTIGAEYLIPLLGVWDTTDEIDFDTLPNQFVLKCNHNSGGLCICKDKSRLNIPKEIRALRKNLGRDYYLSGREWPYKNVPRKIIAEQYMEEKRADGSCAELKDYKLMCFGGRVRCSFVCSDRFSEEGLRVTFFDRDWNRMPFERHYPASPKDIPKPQNYDAMLRLAEALAQNIPFVRVDFYEINGRLYFGELTLYPGGGWEEFIPEKWDSILGDWLELPEKDF